MAKKISIKDLETLSVQHLEWYELDYWVARAEGIKHPPAMREMEPGFVMVPVIGSDDDGSYTTYAIYSPTSNWNQGGEILYREKIGLDTWQGDWAAQFAHPRDIPEEKFSPSHCRMRGDTPLIAAMRTYVAFKFGQYFTPTDDGGTTVAERPERPKFKPLKQSSED